MTYVATPAAAIDVTAGTALDIDIGAGHEATGIPWIIIIWIRCNIVSNAIHIFHIATGTSCVDIFLDLTAKQGNVGGARHHSLRTIAAAINVVTHIGTFVDDDVGAVSSLGQCQVCLSNVCRVFSVVNLCHPHQGIGKVGRSVLPIGGIWSRIEATS